MVDIAERTEVDIGERIEVVDSGWEMIAVDNSETIAAGIVVMHQHYSHNQEIGIVTVAER